MHSLYIFVLVRLLLAVSATCYNPDGGVVAGFDHQPCRDISRGQHSMCCATNRTSGPEQCLSNGLCTGGGNLFRDSCTDPTWRSPSCLRLCTAGSDWSGTIVAGGVNRIVNYAQSDVQVTSCGDGGYCCGQANNSCCDHGHGIKIPFTIGSATSSTTSSHSSPASGGGGSGLSEGARIGIGIGCGIFVIVVIAAATWFVYKKRFRRTNASKKDVLEQAQGHPVSEMEMWEREPFVERGANAGASVRGIPR